MPWAGMYAQRQSRLRSLNSLSHQRIPQNPKTPGMPYLLALPNEIIYSILQFVDAEDVENCRLVDKRFCDIIDANRHRLPLWDGRLDFCNPLIDTIPTQIYFYFDRVCPNCRHMPLCKFTNGSSEGSIKFKRCLKKRIFGHYDKGSSFHFLKKLAVDRKLTIQVDSIEESFKKHIKFLETFELFQFMVDLRSLPSCAISSVLKYLLASELKIYACYISLTESLNEELERSLYKLVEKGCVEFALEGCEFMELSWLTSFPAKYLRQFSCEQHYRFPALIPLITRWYHSQLKIGVWEFKLEQITFADISALLLSANLPIQPNRLKKIPNGQSFIIESLDKSYRIMIILHEPQCLRLIDCDYQYIDSIDRHLF